MFINKMKGRKISQVEIKEFLKLDIKEIEVTRKLLKIQKFVPKTILVVGDMKFYFSRLLKRPEKGRDQIVMYVRDKNAIIFPRMLYKSQSNGGWRSCPGNDAVTYRFEREPQFHHSKGLGVHYTQETKPSLNLIEHLSAIEKNQTFIYSKDLNFEYFDLSDNKKHKWYTFEKETKVFDDKSSLKEFQCFQPSKYLLKYFPKENISKVFENFNFNDKKLRGFLPNFNNDPHLYILLHSYSIRKCHF